MCLPTYTQLQRVQLKYQLCTYYAGFTLQFSWPEVCNQFTYLLQQADLGDFDTVGSIFQKQYSVCIPSVFIMESYKNNIHRKLIIKHHKDLSWHSEPSKMDEIGKEHLDQESNLVLCQMKVQILSLKANLGILREDTCKCSSDAS